MKIYFCGGGDIRKNELEELDRKVFSELGDNPVVSVLSWASEDPNTGKARDWWDIFLTHFKKLGAKKINIIRIDDSVDVIADKINSCDLLYIAGGATEHLLEHIRNKGISDLIKKYTGTIFGNSAGALCLSRDVIMLPGEDREKFVLGDGVGAVEFSVAVHYNSEYDNLLLELSKKYKIYAIPERVALIYEDGNLHSLGEGIVLFSNGVKSLE